MVLINRQTANLTGIGGGIINSPFYDALQITQYILMTWPAGIINVILIGKLMNQYMINQLCYEKLLIALSALL